MTEQQFCLRWNNYQENLTRILDRLLQSEALVDVTLYVDGRSIRAHKTILSACSPYFEQMFRENTHPHPIVVLRDFLYDDIRGLLDFMYKGEVNVAQQRLGTFIKVAETLQIRGLTNDLEKTKSGSETRLEDVVQEKAHVPSPKRRRRHDSADSETGSSERDDSNHNGPGQFQEKNVPRLDTDRTIPPLLKMPGAEIKVPESSDSTSIPPRRPSTLTSHPPSPTFPSMSTSSEQRENSEYSGLFPSEPGPSYATNQGTSKLQVKEENSIKQEAYEDDMSDEPEIVETYPEMDTSLPASQFQDSSMDGTDSSALGLSSEMELTDGTRTDLPRQNIKSSHFFRKLGEKMFQCLLCNKVVAKSAQHFKIQHMEKSFACPMCGRLFSTAGNLRQHLVVHLNQSRSKYS